MPIYARIHLTVGVFRFVSFARRGTRAQQHENKIRVPNNAA